MWPLQSLISLISSKGLFSVSVHELFFGEGVVVFIGVHKELPTHFTHQHLTAVWWHIMSLLTESELAAKKWKTLCLCVSSLGLQLPALYLDWTSSVNFCIDCPAFFSEQASVLVAAFALTSIFKQRMSHRFEMPFPVILNHLPAPATQSPTCKLFKMNLILA